MPDDAVHGMIGLFANDKFFCIWFWKWGGELCLGGNVAGTNASVGIVMCSVGCYRLNQVEVAKEIASVVIWRTGTFPILKKQTVWKWTEKEAFMVLYDAGFWRIVEHKNIPNLFWIRTYHCALHLGSTWSGREQYYHGFSGLVVSMLASGTQVCGFKPGWSHWIFRT